MNQNDKNKLEKFGMTQNELNELRYHYVDRLVDNMSTKDLVQYVFDDMSQYVDNQSDAEFLEDCRNYWDDSFDDVVEEIKDYDNYLFYSPINIWDIQKKYAHITDKVQILEFDIYPGNIIYIPPHWWYSTQFIYEDDTPCLCSSITYITAMNALSNAKNYFLYFIQQSNTKVVNAKTITKDELNDKMNSQPAEETEETENTEEIDTSNDTAPNNDLINKSSDI